MSKQIRVGRTPSGVDVFLNPVDAAHTLFSGQTRSGKSVAVYGALAQLDRKSTIVAGIDPTGVLFNAIGSELGGNDLRVLGLHEGDRVREIMKLLLSIMDARIRDLLEAGRDRLTDFTPDLPLLVVVLEEYPGTLAALEALDKASGARVQDRLETMVRASVQRLALEGAKVGIRLWLVAQRADASLLTGVLRAQLTQKLSFRQDSDGLRMLHTEAEPSDIARMQHFPAGRGFIEVAGRLPLTEFQADLIEYDTLIALFRGGGKR